MPDDEIFEPTGRNWIRRCRAYLKGTNKSNRVDATYIKGQDRYLYRAVDSTKQTNRVSAHGQTRCGAAKRFFSKTLLDQPISQSARLGSSNVDKNRAYLGAVEELKVEGTFRCRFRLRQCKYLNNVVDQDHRVSKIASMVGERIPIVFDGVEEAASKGGPDDSETASQMGGQKVTHSRNGRFIGRLSGLTI